MNRFIKKYEIPIQPHFELSLPLDVEILAINIENVPFMYCASGTGELFSYSFRLAKTLERCDLDKEKYIATFSYEGIVHHLFEVL